MRVRAFAKINLSLRVVGRRADGYHDLRTIFQSIALHDTLTIRRRRGPFALTCNDPACPTDATNLVWRAAERVWRAAGKTGAPRDVAIHLTKRIPMQGGLGGGSSDAAATVRTLARAWRVPRTRQLRIARALGADVPYFFVGGTALGVGRGDRLSPLADEPPAWVLIVVPNFGISTKDAFAWHDALAPRRGRVERDAVNSATASTTRREGLSSGVGMHNDLERAVTMHRPAIGRLLRALRRAGAPTSGLSGSGSAVFGLFASRAAAARAAAVMRGPDRQVVVTRTIGAAAYRRLAGN